MKDRFKLRVWDNVVKKYLTDNDVYEITNGILNNLYNLLIDENRRFILGKHDLTFEQCTGLKDKNGKLIYAGDIFKSVYTKNTYVVVREKHFACFSYKHKNVGTMLSEGDIANYELEVVGNIHEKPELMEER